ncbi:MAG: PH domain-containing protein [Clostridiaceae bacterium]|nr:PH domain-containing protein [Clostridiaceae bacterium]
MSKQKDNLNSLIVEDEILWKDRKRYFGLPISFTVYSFDCNRLYVKRGLLHTTVDELLLYRVLDIRLARRLSQKIFGVGSIILDTADKTNSQMTLKNIKDSERVRKALSAIVEKERDEKRVLGKEMFGASGDMGDLIDNIDINMMS